MSNNAISTYNSIEKKEENILLILFLKSNSTES